jgi:hypothetical protein
MDLPDPRSEACCSEWEFKAPRQMTASDVATMSVAELLALAGTDPAVVLGDLRLGYTERWGDPVLRRAIAGTCDGLDADDVSASPARRRASTSPRGC